MTNEEMHEELKLHKVISYKKKASHDVLVTKIVALRISLFEGGQDRRDEMQLEITSSVEEGASQDMSVEEAAPESGAPEQGLDSQDVLQKDIFGSEDGESVAPDDGNPDVDDEAPSTQEYSPDGTSRVAIVNERASGVERERWRKAESFMLRRGFDLDVEPITHKMMEFIDQGDFQRLKD